MEFRKALLYTFTSKYILLLIQFGATLILSRLLTPEDIGIYTIAYSLVVIGHVFRDFGVGNYIHQEKELTTDRIRAAMSVAFTFAWLMSFIIYVSADMAAEFYNEEGIKKVFQVLALNFFLIPFGSVTTSYIRRQMRFKFVMRLEVVSTLVSTATVISLAYLGFSYMSMAWSSVAGIVIEIATLLYFRPKELPKLPGVKQIKHVLAFSTASVSESLLAQVGAHLPDLIIGRILGMSSVGLLSRAKGTVNLFDRAVTSAINPVLIPYFSKENRKGQDIKMSFLHLTTCVTVLAWPALIYMIVMAEPLIYILYGEQWSAAAILLQIICLRQIFARLMAFVHPALMSKGKVKILLKLQVFFMPLEIVITLMTVNYGLETMLYSLLIVPFIRMIILYRILKREIGLKLLDTVRVIYQCALPTAFPMAYMIYIYKFWPMEPLYSLIVSATGAFFVFMVSLVFFKHPITKEFYKFYGKP